jgi:predicted dehydrogenase
VPSKAGDYRAYYDAIADALTGRADVPVDPDDAVAGLNVLEAARRSSAEGRIVAVTARGWPSWCRRRPARAGEGR